MQKQKFSLYRDLDNRITYVVENELPVAVRIFNTPEFEYGVVLSCPEDVVKIPMKEYLERDEPFAKFLKPNKKEFLHKEIIANEHGIAIDRALAHMVGDMKINGVSYVQRGIHVWATVDIEGIRYAIYYKRAGANYYQNCIAGGHCAANDESHIESVAREVEEEIGIKTTPENLTFCSELKLEEVIRGSKVNSEYIFANRLHLQPSDLEKMVLEKIEISGHILIPIGELKNFSAKLPVQVDYKIENGKLEKVDFTISLADMNPELITVNAYHFDEQYKILNG